MVTADHLLEAHNQAIASLNPAQRAAVDLMFDMRTQLSFSAPTAQARLARRLRTDAASLNRQLLRVDAPTE